MIKLNGVEVKPTIFPDGTSQVWKLPATLGYNYTIVWNWEGNEAELFHLCQLVQLIGEDNIAFINIPYLPYARQDKEVDNELTFAKNTFIKTIRKFYKGDMYSTDVHSYHKHIANDNMNFKIQALQEEIQPDVLIYPDKSAYERYGLSGPYSALCDVIIIDKVRDQLTGKITGLSVGRETTFKLSSQRILSNVVKAFMVDDICDYGNTFKKNAEFLKQYGTFDISLYVSHFLGHGDMKSYKDAGINKIYTTDSLSLYREKRGFVDTENMLEII